MLGVGLVDKPSGISSHDAIYRSRRSLGIKKIGHSGTLDPLASGLLLIAVGNATRFMRYFTTEPKVYVGTGQLGVETNTQDSTGEIVKKAEMGGVSIANLGTAMSAFVGEIQQLPPMFSAVKIGGERLYKSARKGIDVARPRRPVEVFYFECTYLEEDNFSFRVSCSAGTYVRTLIHDLGRSVGCGAHMTALRRISMGSFSIEHALPPEQMTETALINIETALGLQVIELDGDAAIRATHGNDFENSSRADLVSIRTEAFLGVAKLVKPGVFRPERLIPAP